MDRLLQGTDGLRGRMAGPEVRPQDPVRAFLDDGLLSEPLVELYAYAAAGWLLDRSAERRADRSRSTERGGLARPGALVVAWDPRDPEERFVRAALRGVRKAGGEALAAGVLPTPAAALYMVAVGAAGALVLTASHNPADQNGVKLFLGVGPPNGEARKPLPEEDAELSRRALEVRWPEVERSPLAGELRTVASEARGAYRRYLLEDHERASLAPFRLVLDVSAGAWGGLAAPLLEELGAREVREVNPQGASPVNEGGGVVMLEGRSRVAASEEALIRGHAGLASLFEMGRARREELRRGEGWVACGVLDADGDRALCLLYDPFEDASLILAGDELALLLARLLRGRGRLPASPHFACTIDSDPGATAAVAALGFEVALTPVGDKWLLRAAERAGERFVLGAEASGHLVLRGRLPTSVHRTAGGGALGPAVGDGLQGLVRGLTAVEALFGGLPSEARYRALREPFARSFKRTLYVYYTDRARFFRDSPAWREVSAALEREAEKVFGARYFPQWVDLPDDPDTLFLALRGGEGTQRASLFVRNSGTEARTGLTLQGPREEADA
ncbi:MAG: hypothetical protein ACE5JJ_12090, partial [Nitrospinota bacterium]